MRFYVSRSGWNAANQPSASCPHTMRVATVEADTPEEARALAALRVNVYNGQYLTADLADAVDAEEAAIDAAVEVL